MSTNNRNVDQNTTEKRKKQQNMKFELCEFNFIQ